MKKCIVGVILFLLFTFSFGKNVYASEDEDFLRYNFLDFQSYDEPHRVYVIVESGNLYCIAYDKWEKIINGETTFSKEKGKVILKNVKSISENVYAVHALTEKGDVYGWGSNYYGCVGNGTTKRQDKPVKIISNIEHLYDGTALSKDGDVYTWSDFRIKSNSYSPKKILSGVKKVVTEGGNYLLMLKDNGEVWAVGKNDKGQIGNGKEGYVSKPVKVASNMRDIWAYHNASMAISKDDVLYVWGNTFKGVFATSDEKITKPRKYLSDVKYVSYNGSYMFIINNDNELFQIEKYYEDSYQGVDWGNGLYYLEPKYAKYRPIKILDNVKAVFGNMAITESNELYSLWHEEPMKLANKIKYLIPYDIDWLNYFISESNNLYYIDRGYSESTYKMKMVSKVKVD